MSIYIAHRHKNNASNALKTKTKEPILKSTGTSGPCGKFIERLAVGVRK